MSIFSRDAQIVANAWGCFSMCVCARVHVHLCVSVRVPACTAAIRVRDDAQGTVQSHSTVKDGLTHMRILHTQRRSRTHLSRSSLEIGATHQMIAQLSRHTKRDNIPLNSTRSHKPQHTRGGEDEGEWTGLL